MQPAKLLKFTELNECMIPIAVVDPGGVPPACAPQQDPILSFSHTFLLKSIRIRGSCPPNGSAPPMGNPGSATALYDVKLDSIMNRLAVSGL